MSNYVCLDAGNTSPTTYTWGGDWCTATDSTDYIIGDMYTDIAQIGTATPYIQNPTVIKEIVKEKVVTKEVEKRTLYKVYVVDPRKQGKILLERAVIAANENQAMLKAGVAEAADSVSLELEKVKITEGDEE